jgi:hypothetical protein
MKRFFAGAAALTIALASPAAAATLITNGSGELTGAAGVMVNGASYDVEFVDGTCAAHFGGCDSDSDFTFVQADAYTAAQVLLDQVFTGAFDTDYTRTFGCGANSTGSCWILVPYIAPSQFGTGLAAIAKNTDDVSDPLAQTGYNFAGTDDTGTGPVAPLLVFARFMPSVAAVPEPSTWAMMLLGLGAIGAATRRRKSLAAV